MDIKHRINIRLQNLQAENLPTAVLNNIEAEVLEWERQLIDSARRELIARIEKRVTKPFIAKHFAAEFRKRKPVSLQAEGR